CICRAVVILPVRVNVPEGCACTGSVHGPKMANNASQVVTFLCSGVSLLLLSSCKAILGLQGRDGKLPGVAKRLYNIYTCLERKGILRANGNCAAQCARPPRGTGTRTRQRLLCAQRGLITAPELPG